MYNYWRTKQTEVLALTPVAPMIGAEGQFDGHPEWADANQKPYSRLEYVPITIEQPDGSKQLVPPPQRSPPIAVPAGFSDAATSAAQDLAAVAGMPHEPGVDTPGTVVSGVALRKRQALSDIGHFQYYDNQTQAIAQIGRICLDYIPIYYSTERMQRIIGEDGVPSMVGINQFDPALGKVKNDLTVGRYDVVMDTTPQGMQKVMDGLPKEAQTVVKSLMTQMNQLQQQNQQLAADLKYGLTKTHLQETSRQVLANQHNQLRPASQGAETTAPTEMRVLEGRTNVGPAAKTTEAFAYENAETIEDGKNG